MPPRERRDRRRWPRVNSMRAEGPSRLRWRVTAVMEAALPFDLAAVIEGVGKLAPGLVGALARLRPSPQAYGGIGLLAAFA